MADVELCETEALRGHINCGGVMLNLDKLTFSLSCIYCDLEMLSIKEFGYHFQEHLVMSKAENERLLKNIEENVPGGSRNINEVEPQLPIVTKTEELTEKQADYEIEMLEDTIEDDRVEISTNNENVEEEQFVYQVMNNEIVTEFHNSPELNNLEIQQIDEQETVDIGFDLLPDESPVLISQQPQQQFDGLTCDVCDFKFTDIATLRKHRQHHHRCNICKKSFNSKAQLNVHLRTHKYKTIYDCRECGESFTTTTDLAAHQTTHEHKTLYLCSTCGKGFQDERLLRQHIKVHTSARPFVCLECNMTFSKNHALMLHTKLHADVRKFNCSICRMTFAQNSGLINHLRERHSNTAISES